MKSESENKDTHLQLDEWQLEWKYDGIRVQLVSTPNGTALFSRTGDDISHSFPDLLQSVDFLGVFDGELLIIKHGVIGSFNDLQQRLNKKRPSKKLQQNSPAGMVVYDAIQLADEVLTDTAITWAKSQINCVV